MRPAEVDHPCADPTLAREGLGWTPETGFEDLVRLIVNAASARLNHSVKSL